jgi:hypothetical protein
MGTYKRFTPSLTYLYDRVLAPAKSPVEGNPPNWLLPWDWLKDGSVRPPDMALGSEFELEKEEGVG